MKHKKKMEYCRAVFFILLIFFAVQSKAELSPRLNTLYEFGTAISKYILQKYEYIVRIRGPRECRGALDQEEGRMSTLVENILQEYKEKFEAAEEAGKYTGKCDTSVSLELYQARHEMTLALDNCTTKNGLDEESLLSRLQTILAVGTDYQNLILKLNEECRTQRVSSTKSCVESKILGVEKKLQNYRIESAKFRKSLLDEVDAAVERLKACYSDPIIKFKDALLKARKNCDDCMIS